MGSALLDQDGTAGRDFYWSWTLRNSLSACYSNQCVASVRWHLRTRGESRRGSDLYDALLDVSEFVLAHSAQAQSRSSALTTAEGIRFRLAAPGHHPCKVVWSSDGPRIEAVFPFD